MRERIFVIYLKPNNINGIFDVLINTDSLVGRKVIGSQKDPEYSPKSSMGYLHLKNNYQILEEKGEFAFNEFRAGIDTIVYKNKEINIETKKGCDYFKVKTIYENLLKNSFLKCEYCDEELSIKKATIDHFIPRSCGGEDSSDNYRVSCRTCNVNKSCIHPVLDKALFKEFLFFSKNKKNEDFIEHLKNYFTPNEYYKIVNKQNMNLSRKLHLIKDILILKAPVDKVREFNLASCYQILGHIEKHKKIMDQISQMLEKTI